MQGVFFMRAKFKREFLFVCPGLVGRYVGDRSRICPLVRDRINIRVKQA